MDYACLLFVYNNWFLPPPKLFNGLPIAMVLLPCIEDDDATQGTKFLLLYTKDNNPNNKQPWVPNPWTNSLQGKKKLPHLWNNQRKEKGERKNRLPYEALKPMQALTIKVWALR